MKRISTLMLAAAALLASCSQNDELQNTVNENEGLNPMTISVALPEGMTTRATAADDATDARCFVQILSGDGQELDGGHSAVQPMTKTTGGGYSTTVYLNGNDTYDFLFWADSEQSGTTPDDLRNVPYTNGSTLAWAGTALDQQWSASGVSCKLEHVVSRITLNTTTNLTVDASYPLTIEVPAIYTAYNVQNMSPVETAVQRDFTYSFEPAITISTASESIPVQIGHFYALVNDEPQVLTLHYTGPLNNPAKEISNVPLAPNTHVVLNGDVANWGLTQGIITATVDSDWTDSDKSF